MYNFPTKPIPTELNRIVLLKETTLELTNIICNLPSYGTISYDSSTYYWYIKLPKEWQNATIQIVNVIYKIYNKTKWYKESEQLGKYWYDLVNIVNNNNNINNNYCCNSVTPPSVVGMS